jgi:putative restriction endonuclease
MVVGAEGDSGDSGFATHVCAGLSGLGLGDAPALCSGVSLDSIIEKLYDLNVGVVGTGAAQHERPHKPVLLLAVLELVDNGADATRVEWSETLRAAFKRSFEIVRQRDDRPNPELPFFHLRSDNGLWAPKIAEAGVVRDLAATPRVRDMGKVFAELDPELAAAVGDEHLRAQLKAALVARYFPTHSDALLGPAVVAEESPVADDEAQPGRSAAFRKKVLEIYAHKCTACGLQVRIGNPPLSLVDAAHLLPFASSHNDHPTNGLALCKNHHWAMDRAFIAPTPDGVWRASAQLIPHRSSGERELVELDGRRMIPPRDEAYRPSREGLSFRYEAMLAAQG